MEMSPFISFRPVLLTATGVLIEELAVLHHYLFKHGISSLVSISVSATQPGRLSLKQEMDNRPIDLVR